MKSKLSVNIPESNNCNEEFDWWNCNSSGKVDIQPGYYSMSLIFKSKKQVDLEIKLKSGRYKTIPIELSKGQHFPEYNGDIDLKGKDIDQNFDLAGAVDTEVTNSDTYNGEESCTKTIRRKVCRRVHSEDGGRHGRKKKNRRGGGRGKRVCEYETEYVTGTQSVEYYYQTTRTDVELEFLSSNSEFMLAKFQGGKSDSDKIYNYKGQCYIY